MSGVFSRPGRPKFTAEFVPGAGYYVFDPEGRRVSGPYGCQANALTSRDCRQHDLDMKALRKHRPCITCQDTFLSDGPHNRMCGGCRLKSDDTRVNSFSYARRRAG